MKNSIISTGNTFRVYDDSVVTHSVLPPLTYRVVFSELTGYSLEKIEDLTVGSETIYGNHEKRVARIMSTYQDMNRSLGVLLSGDKGMGKSLMIRLLADKVRELGLPTIMVSADTPGIADFIDSLGEALIVFDEFEKTFPMNGEKGNAQNQFLGLFDGTSSNRRLYAMSVNELRNLSDYLVNRPGRFHYHIRFDYPNANEIRAYFREQSPNISEEELEKVISFSRKVSVNFDHLRAIAYELNKSKEEKFEEIIGDLNIKRVNNMRYKVTVTTEKGVTLSSLVRDLNMFDPSVQFLTLESSLGYYDITIDVSKLLENGGVFVGGADAVSFDKREESATKAMGLCTGVTVSLASSQQNVAF